MSLVIGGFTQVRSKSDCVLSVSKRPSKRCIVIFSHKFKAYYIALTKNATAYYNGFVSLFKGNTLFGSSALRAIAKDGDRREWEFFIGKVSDTLTFLTTALIIDYKEISRDRHLPKPHMEVTCRGWTITDLGTGLARTIVTTHSLSNVELFTRYKRSLLRLRRILSRSTPGAVVILERIQERAREALILEDYSEFSIEKENLSMEFCETTNYTRDRNIHHLRSWLSVITHV